MVTLEQIRLLESKVGRAIEFVARLTEEKARLTRQNDELRETITALRQTVETLKEEKSRVEEEKSRIEEEKNRVEEGIASALGKLDQFEDAIEQTLKAVGENAADSAAGNDDTEDERLMAELEEEQRRIEAEKRERALAEQPEEDLPASAYAVEEEIEDTTEETAEDATEEDLFGENKSGDSGEAELDIF